MIERVIVRRRAKRDIREARRWYRDISSELGDELVTSVDEANCWTTRNARSRS